MYKKIVIKVGTNLVTGDKGAKKAFFVLVCLTGG